MHDHDVSVLLFPLKLCGLKVASFEIDAGPLF